MRRRKAETKSDELVLTGLKREEEKFSDPVAFTNALIRRIDEVQPIDDVYSLWARNADSIKSLANAFEAKELAERTVETFKTRARLFAPRIAKKELRAPAQSRSKRAMRIYCPKKNASGTAPT